MTAPAPLVRRRGSPDFPFHAPANSNGSVGQRPGCDAGASLRSAFTPSTFGRRLARAALPAAWRMTTTCWQMPPCAPPDRWSCGSRRRAGRLGEVLRWPLVSPHGCREGRGGLGREVRAALADAQGPHRVDGKAAQERRHGPRPRAHQEHARKAQRLSLRRPVVAQAAAKPVTDNEPRAPIEREREIERDREKDREREYIVKRRWRAGPPAEHSDVDAPYAAYLESS